MYEKVQRPKEEQHRGMWIVLFVGIAALVAVGAGFLISNSIRASDYQNFVTALSESTNYAYEAGVLTVTRKGVAYPQEGEDIFTLYQLLTVAKAGKPQKTAQPPEDDYIQVDFGNGSWMQLWPTRIEEENAKREEGLWVRYVDASGMDYSYDTDATSYVRICNRLGLYDGE